jgi:hypothetical protein
VADAADDTAHEVRGATIDETDPWTGEAIPHERIAAPASRPLDNVDPWTGETIVVKGSALVQRETLDPYSAD